MPCFGDSSERDMKIRMIFSLTLSFARILLSFIALRLTLSWNARKARRTFEKQLIRQGMAKEDAKRLGSKYVALKNNIENAFKESIRRQR